MPNFKVFQDVADEMRVKIFGSADVALNTDTGGRLAITSPGLAITTGTGSLAVSIGTGDLPVTSAGLAITTGAGALAVSIGTGNVPVTSTGLAITTGAGALSVSIGTGDLPVTSTGLAITTGTGSLSVCIGTGTVGTAINSRTILDSSENITVTTVYAPAVTTNVLEYITYTLAAVNTGTTAAQVKVQISPNNTDWIDDGTAVTVDAGALVTLVPSVFLKYVRLAAIATTTSATLTAFIQGQK